MKLHPVGSELFHADWRADYVYMYCIYITYAYAYKSAFVTTTKSKPYLHKSLYNII